MRITYALYACTKILLKWCFLILYLWWARRQILANLLYHFFNLLLGPTSPTWTCPHADECEAITHTCTLLFFSIFKAAGLHRELCPSIMRMVGLPPLPNPSGRLSMKCNAIFGKFCKSILPFSETTVGNPSRPYRWSHRRPAPACTMNGFVSWR